MALDLPEIRSVIRVAKMGSLSAAAEELHISQPALSRRIAHAEEALGVKLFDRLPRGVSPTDACLAFMQHAEAALMSLEDAREAAREARDEGQRPLPIGFVESICDPWLTETMRQVVDRMPDTIPVFRPYLLGKDVSAAIVSGEVKLGLRFRHDENALMQSLTLFVSKMTIIAAPDHPLTRQRTVTTDELAREQWLDYPVSSERATSFNAMLASGSFGARKVITLTNLKIMEQLVAAGFGIALARRANVASRIAEGTLAEIAMPFDVSIPVTLAWRRKGHLGKRAELLRDLIISQTKDADG